MPACDIKIFFLKAQPIALNLAIRYSKKLASEMKPMEKGPFKAYPFSLHRSVLGNEGFTKNKIKWID